MRRFQILLAAALTAVLMSGTAFAAGSDKFVAGTYIGGVNLSGQTVDSAKTYIEGFYSDNYKLTLKERGGATETLSGTDLGLRFSAPSNLSDILSQQQAEGAQAAPNVTHSYDAVGMQANVSDETLSEKLSGLDAVKNATQTKDAYITAYQEGAAFQVVPEVNGNSINMERLVKAVKDAINTGKTELDLDAAGVYDAVSVTADSLQAQCEKMNGIKDMKIGYQIGEQQDALYGSQIIQWITGVENGEVAVDRTKVAEYVAALAAKYDTAGGVQTWKSASGRDASIKTSYGWKIDQNAETDALVALIKAGNSQENREPAWAKKGNQWAMPQWGNTFVEVDLTNQHVYFYKDGQCVWDSATVTGLKSDPDRVTPTGVSAIYSKERNRVLRGKKDKNGKYAYESPVSYWMPFNGGVGLHDATWRNKFGGSIYTYAGSHGCINLPLDKAAALYDLISVGTPVVVYE